mmetsp:Transcript_8780/g.9720  ORF Transcript_8780/g.9720 Transcript_8780/m.9720 type:complete len:91 (+) Transcript_8780:459-731(+)
MISSFLVTTRGSVKNLLSSQHCLDSDRPHEKYVSVFIFRWKERRTQPLRIVLTGNFEEQENTNSLLFETEYCIICSHRIEIKESSNWKIN